MRMRNYFFALFCGNIIIELLRGGAINYYMHAGHKEADCQKEPDTSPIGHYTVKLALTRRDLNELEHLVNRNYASLTCGWLPTTIAVTKVINQVVSQDLEELDNYDNDGAKPEHHAPEHEEID